MRRALTEGASHHGGLPIARWALGFVVVILVGLVVVVLTQLR